MSKDGRQEFQRELKTALLAHLNEQNQVIVARDLDGTALSGFDETEDTATATLVERVEAIVSAFTTGWSVDKTMLDLDKDKILRDPAAPLESERDDYDTSKATKVVVYEISTAHRPLTEAEQAKLDEDNARREAQQVQRSTMYRWELSDQGDPPPDGTTIGTLLNHRVWWLTKDKRAIPIAEMEPSHRANLYRLMLRNADAWKEVEFHRFLAQGAPDDVTSSAEYMTGKAWLADKELFQALRKLVLTDQVGVGACLIEWSDDKPVGCLSGADGHVCVFSAGHKKRCSCRCGARPAKNSAAARKAMGARQLAMVEQPLSESASSADRAVRSTAPAEAELDAYVERYGPLNNEDIH